MISKLCSLRKTYRENLKIRQLNILVNILQSAAEG